VGSTFYFTIVLAAPVRAVEAAKTTTT
jgi:hypothetical protein